jgi:hypothetical protein
MATVRMSDRLLRDIRQNAKKKYRVVNPEKEYPLADTFYSENIAPKLDKLIQQFNETLNNMVNYTIKSVEQINFNVDVPTNDPARPIVTETFSCKFSSERKVPSFMSSSWYSAEINLPFEHEFAQQLYNISQYNKKRKEQEHTYVDKIENVCKEFSTLNQAMKAWPALKDLVPQDSVQKLYEKVNRKAKQQQQRDFIVEQEQELNEVLLESKLLEEI